MIDRSAVSPKERVRLSTDTLTEQRKASEDVCRERIKAQGDVKR